MYWPISRSRGISLASALVANASPSVISNTTDEWPSEKYRPTPSGRFILVHQTARRVVDRRDVIGIERMPQPECVREARQPEQRGMAGAAKPPHAGPADDMERDDREAERQHLSGQALRADNGRHAQDRSYAEVGVRRSADYCSARLKTLPVRPSAGTSRNSIVRGYLYAAICSRLHAMSSSAESARAGLAGRRTPSPLRRAARRARRSRRRATRPDASSARPRSRADRRSSRRAGSCPSCDRRSTRSRPRRSRRCRRCGTSRRAAPRRSRPDACSSPSSRCGRG